MRFLKLPSGVLVGVGSGLASAALFYSAAQGSPALSAILLLLTPLPTLLAAVGWGLSAALAGAAAGAVLIAAVSGVFSALSTTLALGAPATLIAYLASLSRAVGGDPTVREWYPAGRLLAAIAIYGSLLPLLMLPLSGGTYDDLRAPMTELVRRFSNEATTDFGMRPLTDAQIENATRLLIITLPGFIAGYWTAVFSLNTYLAARIARASGRLERPWPDLPALALPRDLLVVAGIALLACFATGLVRVVGVSVVGGFGFMFFLAGLSLMHAIARRRTYALLVAVYLALLLAGPYTAVMLILAGLTDTAIGLKRRFAGPAPAA